MATLEQIEQALRAADAAGNVEDARMLAQAYAQMRAQGGAEKWRPKQRTADDLRAMAAENPADPTEGMPWQQKLAAGAGRALVETGRGVGQLVGAVDESQVAQARETDAPLLASGFGMAGNILGQAAQIAAPVPGAAALKVGGKLAPYLASAGRAATFGAAQGTVGDESRGKNAAIEGAFGAAGQGIAQVGGIMAKRAAAKLPGPIRESIDLARAADIPLRADQVTTSPAIKATAAVTRWLPFSRAARSGREQQEAFNAAVGRSFGVDGAKVLSEDVMKGARKSLGAKFEDIYSRNNVTLNGDAMRKLAAIEREAMENLETGKAQVVRNQFEKILRELPEDGILSGKKYQSLRDSIRKAEDGGPVGHYVKNLRTALDDIAAESVGPEDAARLKKIRGQWANLRTAEDSLKQVAGAAGNVKPASLYPLIRRGSTPEMRELAKIGQNVLKDVVNDSGTAQRSFYQNLLTGGGTAGAAAGAAYAGLLGPLVKAGAAGSVLGRMLNSNTGAKMLEQGKPTAQLAKLLKTAPRLGPPGAMQLQVAGGQPGAWTPEDEEELMRLRQEMEARRSAYEGR